MLILGIETSCDDSSVALLEDSKVLACVTASQAAEHMKFGGVVPEIASRAHALKLLPTLHFALQSAKKSLSDINLIAVTQRPGLHGSLLVGLSTAKALSYALKCPLLPVDHLEGHIMSLYLEHTVQYPILVLLASGGHTSLHLIHEDPSNWLENISHESMISATKDDAAGEAFDKVAKLLRLSFPGGPAVEEAAKMGNPKAIKFPRPMPQSLDFSFSGIKTAVAKVCEKSKLSQEDLAASAQEAILDSILQKIKKAIQHHRPQSLGIVGGVASNLRLRQKLNSLGIPWIAPSLQYCTDNGAMIAKIGEYRYSQALIAPDFFTLTVNTKKLRAQTLKES